MKNEVSKGGGRKRGERGGGGKDNTLLLEDKDLSSSGLFYKSVPDNKHSNTQCIKQEYK